MTPMTIDEFGRKLRARELSVVDATNACLARIEADNARLNAFVLVMADEARRQAAANRRAEFPTVAIRPVASRAPALKHQTPRVGILRRQSRSDE